MAGRRRRRDGEEKPNVVYVQRRTPRDGVKRAKTLVFLDDYLKRLEKHATDERTTCAEILMDWIEEKLIRRKPREQGSNAEAAGAEGEAA